MEKRARVAWRLDCAKVERLAHSPKEQVLGTAYAQIAGDCQHAANSRHTDHARTSFSPVISNESLPPSEYQLKLSRKADLARINTREEICSYKQQVNEGAARDPVIPSCACGTCNCQIAGDTRR